MDQLQQSVIPIHKKRWLCMACDLSYSCKSSLVRHQRIKHAAWLSPVSSPITTTTPHTSSSSYPHTPAYTYTHTSPPPSLSYTHLSTPTSPQHPPCSFSLPNTSAYTSSVVHPRTVSVSHPHPQTLSLSPSYTSPQTYLLASTHTRSHTSVSVLSLQHCLGNLSISDAPISQLLVPWATERNRTTIEIESIGSSLPVVGWASPVQFCNQAKRFCFQDRDQPTFRLTGLLHTIGKVWQGLPKAKALSPQPKQWIYTHRHFPEAKQRLESHSSQQQQLRFGLRIERELVLYTLSERSTDSHTQSSSIPTPGNSGGRHHGSPLLEFVWDQCLHPYSRAIVEYFQNNQLAIVGSQVGVGHRPSHIGTAVDFIVRHLPSGLLYLVELKVQTSWKYRVPVNNDIRAIPKGNTCLDSSPRIKNLLQAALTWVLFTQTFDVPISGVIVLQVNGTGIWPQPVPEQLLGKELHYLWAFIQSYLQKKKNYTNA
jgi:hypothetical protein